MRGAPIGIRVLAVWSTASSRQPAGFRPPAAPGRLLPSGGHRAALARVARLASVRRPPRSRTPCCPVTERCTEFTSKPKFPALPLFPEIGWPLAGVTAWPSRPPGCAVVQPSGHLDAF